MRQTREVEFAEQCLQPWEEGLKRHRVNRQSGKDQSGRSQVMGQLHHLVLDSQSIIRQIPSQSYIRLAAGRHGKQTGYPWPPQAQLAQSHN